MVLFEHTIVNDTIVIKYDELETEYNRILNNINRCNSEEKERIAYLSGQLRTINDTLMYFRYPEGRDNTDVVSII